MSIEVKVPVLPESVADATVATWHKKAGDRVSRDENLVDLETDKVVLEVPAPVDGVLKEIRSDSGSVVSESEVLAIIEEGAAPAGDDEDDESEAPQDKQEPAAEKADDDQGKARKPESGAADLDELSPAVRRLVEENDLDVSRISGTGRDGRITKEDVVKHMKSSGDAAGERDQAKQAPEKTAEKPAPAPVPAGDRPEERVKMSRLRSRIAERMVEAQSTAAMLTSFNEVDLKAVIELRSRYKEDFAERHGVKLGFMSFFVKACCEALQKYPVVNASVDGDDVIYHGYCDVGIAVSTERGLMVPVLRDAEKMSLAEIERGIAEFAKQARSGSIKLEDLQGGTFTVTNGGVFGSLISTPILNMPQSAILGMHAIKERPVVVDGEIVARPMMYIALTYDHRIVDGRDAVLFLVAVKETLEDPQRLLLNL